MAVRRAAQWVLLLALGALEVIVLMTFMVDRTHPMPVAYALAVSVSGLVIAIAIWRVWRTRKPRGRISDLSTPWIRMIQHRGRLRIAALGIVAAVLVAGCRSGDPPEGTNADLAHAPYEGTVGNDAALEGTISREGGCTTIEAPDGQRWVPIFPNDAIRWIDDELDLGTTSASPLLVRAGDTVTLGGGEITEPPDDASIPGPCATYAHFWLVTPA